MTFVETVDDVPDHRLAAWLSAIGPADAFQLLADTYPDAAVFAVDAQRNIIAWSQGAEQILGYRPDEVLGAHCLKANRCQNCLIGCGLQEFGVIRDAPLTLFCKDGSSVRVRKHARAFFDHTGQLLGGVEVLTLDRGATALRSTQHRPGALTFHGITSADPLMLEVFQTCRNVAETDANALVRGESGTGKELVARALHAESARRRGPFLAVNCASLTPALMESELFGHVRGAFPGAVADRAGLFRQAHGGTLFLDEIAELPSYLQTKLVHVLEDRQIVPLGGSTPEPIDVRIVAATSRPLDDEVRLGRFRHELLVRLRVVPIVLPSLRDRRGDIELLLWRAIGERNALGGRHIDSIAPAAMRALLDHPWPGNVRELHHVVDYAFAVGRGTELRLDELPVELRPDTTDERVLARRPALAPDEEAARIREALLDCKGHLGHAADRLGISRPTLWRKRKKYGI